MYPHTSSIVSLFRIFAQWSENYILHIRCHIFTSYISHYMNYHKNSENWDSENFYHHLPKDETTLISNALICPKDAAGIVNSVDPDQTAPI